MADVHNTADGIKLFENPFEAFTKICIVAFHIAHILYVLFFSSGYGAFASHD